MTAPPLRIAATILAVTTLGLLGGCAASPDAAVPTPEAETAATPTVTATATPDPEPTATPAAAEIPTDCVEMLSVDVQAELSDIPLNDPAFGEAGTRADGSLHCIWADPAADTTSLQTVIERMSRGPALELLNDLADEGFTCYESEGGVRCEMTWENAQYPVTDGRTLFHRDDILIDTTYSNLAPSGYTSSIVASIWG